MLKICSKEASKTDFQNVAKSPATAFYPAVQHLMLLVSGETLTIYLIKLTNNFEKSLLMASLCAKFIHSTFVTFSPLFSNYNPDSREFPRPRNKAKFHKLDIVVTHHYFYYKSRRIFFPDTLIPESKITLTPEVVFKLLKLRNFFASRIKEIMGKYNG